MVYKRCRFIIEENQRVFAIAEALAAGRHDDAGKLALESLIGARDLYEIVSSEMIAMHHAIMRAPGAFGARGAGAGFGGCLVALIDDRKIHHFTEAVLQDYFNLTGIQAEIYPVKASSGAGLA